MNSNFVDKYFARTLFVLASGAILLAIAEGFLSLFGQSLISGLFAPGRLLDLSATLLAFVVVQLLRQIRDALRT